MGTLAREILAVVGDVLTVLPWLGNPWVKWPLSLVILGLVWLVVAQLVKAWRAGNRSIRLTILGVIGSLLSAGSGALYWEVNKMKPLLPIDPNTPIEHQESPGCRPGLSVDFHVGNTNFVYSRSEPCKIVLIPISTDTDRVMGISVGVQQELIPGIPTKSVGVDVELASGEKHQFRATATLAKNGSMITLNLYDELADGSRQTLDDQGLGLRSNTFTVPFHANRVEIQCLYDNQQFAMGIKLMQSASRKAGPIGQEGLLNHNEIKMSRAIGFPRLKKVVAAFGTLREDRPPPFNIWMSPYWWGRKF